MAPKEHACACGPNEGCSVCTADQRHAGTGWVCTREGCTCPRAMPVAQMTPAEAWADGFRRGYDEGHKAGRAAARADAKRAIDVALGEG